MDISREDYNDLREAKALLENPGMAAKIIAVIGAPLERGFALLPAKWSGTVHQATRLALEKAFQVAVRTLGDGKTTSVPSNRLHKMMVAASGGMGGVFGLAALTVELPVSTVVMLRSIADIARSEGEHIREPEGQLACLEVFALGGRSARDDSSETGYFAVRMGLAQAVSEAARHVAAKGVGLEGAPAVVRFITKVAARFSVTVSEKVAAQAVPVIGAAGGALVNTLFLDHFQDMARGHFIVRRLERFHGRDKVKKAYDSI